MSALDYIVLGLAAWRLASLLVNEQGPFDLFLHLRHAAGIRQTVVTPEGQAPHIAWTARNTVAEALLCVWCMSVWTAALLYLGVHSLHVGFIVRGLTDVLALSAVAVLAHELIEHLRGGQTT